MALIPDVTIDDLASFRPAPPMIVTEPVGFAVKGLPTNTIATATTHQVTGTVLDWDVTVRFTPTRYVFDHGDGTTTTTSTGGTSWASHNAPQFTPTPTSHIYRTRGTATPTVTVTYTASIDFGTGWRPVPGTLTLTATAPTLTILEAHTALVDNTCTTTPTAPGC